LQVLVRTTLALAETFDHEDLRELLLANPHLHYCKAIAFFYFQSQKLFVPTQPLLVW
jgi:hypothetical protein